MVKDGNVIGTFDLIDVPRLIGNAAVEGIAVAAPEFLVRPGPRASAFAERYRRRFGRDPSYADFTGYDFGLIARDMAQRVPATATPAELIAALRSTRIEGVSGRIAFDAEGDASPRVVPAVFRSGKLVAIE
jgi:branched-chain amino acid transport system substrate-binding protein